LGEFVSHKFKKDLGEAKNHLNYIAYRSRETGEKYGVFSERQDNADLKPFMDSLDDKRTSHSEIAVMHTLLFSMSGDEWNRSGFEEQDFRKMIRDIMKDFELQKGITISWVAAEHNESGHPHVHVSIKATYKDRDGVEHRLKITPEDKKFFKQAFKEAKDKTRGFELPDRPREIPVRPLNTDLLDNLIFQINQRLREEEYEREREQTRGR
jgi:hypothetical protein